MKKGIDVLELMDMAVPAQCAVCGKPLTWFPEKGYYGDFGHLLNNTRPHKLYYGDKLIASPHNGLYVCSDNQNKCNNQIGVNRGSRPLLADDIAVKIRQMDADDE